MTKNRKASQTQLAVADEAIVLTDTQELDELAAEILRQKRDIEISFLEIGKLLIQAKKQVRQVAWGKWEAWLSENVDFSVSTARRFMRVARECEKRAALTEMGYTKICAIIQLPIAEQETFLSQAHEIQGNEKTVPEMSTRQLEAAVKKRKSIR